MNNTYTLPVPIDAIAGLGPNPLRDEWKHRDLGGPAEYMANAWDFLVPVGTPVYAAQDGKVIDVRVDSDLEPQPGEIQQIFDNPENSQFKNRARKLFFGANWIILNHGNRVYSIYVHLAKGGSEVIAGNKVGEGSLVGYSGNTGFSGSPHLHWEVYTPNSGINSLKAFLTGKRKSIDARFAERTTSRLWEIVDAQLHN